MKGFRSVCTCPALYPTHSVQHKNSNVSKESVKLFLKLRFVVVIYMLFKLVHHNWGSPCSFSSHCSSKSDLPLSQARQYRKNPPFCLCARTNQALRLSRVKFCAVRMHNAMPWNHLKMKPAKKVVNFRIYVLLPLW